MLLIKAKAGPNGVHGIGLFALEFVPKGTPTWRYESWFDVSYTEEDLSKMSEAARSQVMWYAYFDKETKKYVLCSDDQRFINHSSKNFNIISTPNDDIAARDIQPGEELLCDYNKFDDTYFDRMGIKEVDLV